MTEDEKDKLVDQFLSTMGTGYSQKLNREHIKLEKELNSYVKSFREEIVEIEMKKNDWNKKQWHIINTTNKMYRKICESQIKIDSYNGVVKPDFFTRRVGLGDDVAEESNL